MEKFEGTPGRWIKVGDSIKAPGDIEVAVVLHFEEEEMMAADANLIAAAPDLLEALQELVFLYEHDEGCRELTEYKRAKIAISKALGEE